MDPTTIQLILGGLQLINSGVSYLNMVAEPGFDPSKVDLEELKRKLDALSDLPEFISENSLENK